VAFPSLNNVVSTNGTTASTTPVVNITPNVADELLFVLFRSAVAGAIGWPAGWIEMFDASDDASDDQMAFAYR